jgi:hypothetical protein
LPCAELIFCPVGLRKSCCDVDAPVAWDFIIPVSMIQHFSGNNLTV